MTGLALLDTTVLSYFAIVGHADLIKRVWPREAHATPHVLAEYQAGVAAGAVPAQVWDWLPVMTPTEQELATMRAVSASLHEGERSCIAVAIHRNGTVATDDRDARAVARRLGVPVTGTVGILIRCVHDGLLSAAEANELLSRMIAAGYRSPVTDLLPYV
jgi:predicted nucleic acid-binding protein